MIRTELILRVTEAVDPDEFFITASGVVPEGIVLPAEAMIVDLGTGEFERAVLTDLAADGAELDRANPKYFPAGRLVIALYSEEIETNQKTRVLGLLRKGVFQNARI